MAEPEPQAYFPPDSAVRRITRSRAVLLYGAAALALQVSDERVARGVEEHSDFTADPIARLHRTLEASYASVFAPPTQANDAVRRVNRLHASVKGEGYSAMDPDLLLWVMSTLVMCGIEATERFVRPLPESDKAQYYRETRHSTTRFGLKLTHGPRSWDDFVSYWHARLDDPAVGSSEVSRRVATQITKPTRPYWLRPAGVPARLWLRDTLPPAVGIRLGLPSTLASRIAGRIGTLAARAHFAVAPERLTLTRAARDAEERERSQAEHIARA
ncbi:MAG: oxygenase MpaB family protein [Planctomycetota bacterium]